MFEKRCLGVLPYIIIMGFFTAPVIGADILFLVNDPSGATFPHDALLKDFFEDLGHTVTYFDDDESAAATGAAAETADVVWISESCTSDQISREITAIEVPIIISEPYAWDEMGLTLGQGGTTTVSTTEITIVNPDHFLAAGLSGMVTVLTAISGSTGNAEFAQGQAGEDATVIATATLSDNQTHDILLVYEKGAMLAVPPADGSPQEAADVRIGMFFHYEAQDVLNQNAYALIEAAIDYALGLHAQPAKAKEPYPVDRVIDASRDVILSWQPGDYAPTTGGHIVYLSENYADVNEGIGGIPQDANSYDPGRLAFNTTYYWRVDQVNAPPDSTVHPGNIWSFTTELFSYHIIPSVVTASSFDTDMEPEKTIDGSGLNADDQHDTGSTNMWLTTITDMEKWIQYEFAQPQQLDQMWVWNSNQSLEFFLGYGSRQVTIETSLDGANWTALVDVPEFARAPGAPGYTHNTEVNFGGIAAKYVKLTIYTGWGTALPQVGLSEVRFFTVPVHARLPQPLDGAIDQPIDVTLSWRGGREADVHNVYLGTDPTDLALVAERTSATTLTMATELDQVHYWRVDEINDIEDPALWEGTLWNFTTPSYSLVDDMEDYNNKDNKPWKTWADGFDDNTNGSQVGENPVQQLFGPETNIIHSDRKSLPIWYDNSTASFSEATRSFIPAQDWSRAGIQTLVLFFIKGVDNTDAGRLYVKINDAQVFYEEPTDPPPGWDLWTQWNIDLSTVNTDLSQINTLTIGIEGGTQGVIYVDDIRVYKAAPEPADAVISWWEAEIGTITAPLEILTDDPTASAGQHIGVLEGTGNSNVRPTDGVAAYSFTVPADGVYRLVFRVSIASISNDSFWVRIPGMVTNTSNDTSGWIRFSNITQGNAWHWDEVHSNNDDDQVVEFTLSAGTHTLEIARREDGALLDAIALIR